MFSTVPSFLGADGSTARGTALPYPTQEVLKPNQRPRRWRGTRTTQPRTTEGFEGLTSTLPDPLLNLTPTQTSFPSFPCCKEAACVSASSRQPGGGIVQLLRLEDDLMHRILGFLCLASLVFLV